MAQPKNFGFGEEEHILKATARRFFQDYCPVETLHRQVARSPEPTRGPECIWDELLWKQMVDPVFDNGVRLTAADLHQNPGFGHRATKLGDQFSGYLFVAIFVDIFHS